MHTTGGLSVAVEPAPWNPVSLTPGSLMPQMWEPTAIPARWALWLDSDGCPFLPSTTWRVLRCAALSHLGRVQPFGTPWTAACQAALSVGILQAGVLEWVTPTARMPSSRGSSPGGTEPVSLTSPTLAGGFLTINATWEALCEGHSFWKAERRSTTLTTVDSNPKSSSLKNPQRLWKALPEGCICDPFSFPEAWTSGCAQGLVLPGPGEWHLTAISSAFQMLLAMWGLGIWGHRFLHLAPSFSCLLSPLRQPASPPGAPGGPRLERKGCVTHSQDARASSSRAATPQLKAPPPATDAKLVSSLQGPTKEPTPQKPRWVFTRPSSKRLRAVK